MTAPYRDQSSGPPSTTAEADRRALLGIPPDAGRVLVLTETSHWDPGWLLTSEEYYRLRVRRTLRHAVAELEREPRRIYSVECVFFLRLFFEREPAYRHRIRALVNEGRLRLMGSGVTTPDTIIPSTELLIRDYLAGQEWLRRNAMVAEPEVAYFPDTFGFSPALPEVLTAVGVTAAAVCRLDGMYFFGNETELPGRFPRPGSSAARLLREERTLDFVWQGPHGAEVLCHWVAFTYGQGDLIAHAGVSRQLGIPLAVPARSERHVARRVQHFVDQLAPVSKTPYLHCPIGFDFTSPIRRLGELVEHYNERCFPTTGVWVVTAGLDDYLFLVAEHRDRLPVVKLDPSQYFCGFFTSRPTVKRRAAELADALDIAERLALAPDAPPGAVRLATAELAGAWWTAVTSNHHDFVTGTATDRVVRTEQLPWLDDALVHARSVVDALAGSPRANEPQPALDGNIRVKGTAGSPTAAGIELQTPRVQVRVDPVDGTVRAARSAEGRELLGAGPSFELHLVTDTGGLWRMGHEYAGGRLGDSEPATAIGDVSVERLDDGSVAVCSSGLLGGHRFTRAIVVDPELPVVWCDVVVEVPRHHLVTVSIRPPWPVAQLATDVSGGVAIRPAKHLYDPTFWSVQSFAQLLEARPGDAGSTGEGTAAGAHPGPAGGLTVLLGLPGAVSVNGSPERGGATAVEVIAARNASGETAYGFLPLIAQPARGDDPGPHRCTVGLAFTGPGNWRELGLPSAGRLAGRRARLGPGGRARARAADQVVVAEPADVSVLAAKPAWRGEGAVVRLFSPVAQRCTVRWRGTTLTAARRCDGERDGEDLEVSGDSVTANLAAGISSLRLLAR